MACVQRGDGSHQLFQHLHIVGGDFASSRAFLSQKQLATLLAGFPLGRAFRPILSFGLVLIGTWLVSVIFIGGTPTPKIRSLYFRVMTRDYLRLRLP